MSSKIEVNVTDSGVQFGGAWFSHERITGYTAEQLNSGNCCVTGKQYMKWLSNAAAPVVERQPVCSKCNDTGEVDSGGVQPWGEGINVTCDCQLSPPELAELQAPTNGAIIKDLTEVIAQQAAEIERLKGGQGEAVHQVRSHGSDCWEDISGESLEMCQCQPEEYEVRKLFASQPAPVSVDIDERAEFEAEMLRQNPDADLERNSSDNYMNFYLECAWNGWQQRACLDKVKELNQ